MSVNRSASATRRSRLTRGSGASLVCVDNHVVPVRQESAGGGCRFCDTPFITARGRAYRGQAMNVTRTVVTSTVIAFVAALVVPMPEVLGAKATAEETVDGATTLRFFTHDTQQTALDLGPPGPGPGDQLIFSGDVFTHPGGERLGYLAGQVTTLSGDATSGEVLFSSTFVLEGGQIAVQALADRAALLSRGETFPLVILGGTGTFSAARGAGTIQVPNQTDANFVLNIATS
jgi:hypothetical protein